MKFPRRRSTASTRCEPDCPRRRSRRREQRREEERASERGTTTATSHSTLTQFTCAAAPDFHFCRSLPCLIPNHPLPTSRPPSSLFSNRVSHSSHSTAPHWLRLLQCPSHRIASPISPTRPSVSTAPLFLVPLPLPSPINVLSIDCSTSALNSIRCLRDRPLSRSSVPCSDERLPAQMRENE